MVQALIFFYQLEVRLSGKDIKRDLLVNLLTGFILSDEVYFLIFNLISIHQSRELHKLSRVMNDSEVLGKELSFEKLKVKP